MKTRTQKLISLVLVLMMLVTMVPMGIFSANAAVSAELSAGLADYDNTTEFVINSVEDWEALATAQATNSWTFQGKTIKLGADIDAQSGALSMLISKGSFYGTFDGQGNTIENATVTGSANTAVITTAMGGGKVMDLTFNNVTVTNSGTGAVHTALIAAHNSTWAELCELTDITVTNCTLNSAGTGGTGFVVGNHSGNNASYVENISNVTITGSTINAMGGCAGALVGQSGTNGKVNVSNVKINANVYNNATARVAGAIGMLYGSLSAEATGVNTVEKVNVEGVVSGLSYFTGGVCGRIIGTKGQSSISNVYCDVDVSVKDNNNAEAEINKTANSSADQNAGGLAGVSQTTLTVSNVYLSGQIATPGSYGCFIGDIESATTTTANDVVVAMTLDNPVAGYNRVGIAGFRGGSSLKYTNLYSTFDGSIVYSLTAPRGYFLTVSGTNYANSVTSTGFWDNTKVTDIGFVSMTVAQAMLNKDANGYVSSVKMPTGLALDLLNYSTTSTFVINSVEDWELLASYGATSNFSNKNVVLGKDIDAQGATLPTLVAVGAGSCAIRFDGAGYTIRNVGTAQAPQTEPLITGKFADATIQDVTFENVIMVGNDATNGSALIADWASAWATGTITNIVVKGCSITDTAGYAAALIGRYVHNSVSNDILNISNVIIDANTTIEGALHTGGLVGNIGGNGGVNNFSNIYSEANLSAAQEQYVGGVVGYLTGSASASHTHKNTFTNCVIKGTLTAINGGNWTGRIGGVFGRATNAVDVNVYNSIFAPSSATGSMVLSHPIGSSNGSQDLDFRNCYYKTKTFTSVYYVENTTHTYNGTIQSTAGHKYYAGVLETAADKIESLYRTDANGFVTYVSDHIDAEAIQSSNVSDGTYAVRFIALSQLAEATDVNMVVIATYTDGTGTHKLKFDSAASTTGECILYDYLTVYSEYGIATRAVSASEYNAEKLAGFTIYGIPTGYAISFEVTTSYVDADGIVVTGANAMTVNFDANGALVK